MVHVHSLLGGFMDISLRSASLIKEALFVVKGKGIPLQVGCGPEDG